MSKDGAVVMWECDKTVEEMQHYSEQRQLPEMETTRAESDDDSVQDAEEELGNSQATQQEDVSDEGIM